MSQTISLTSLRDLAATGSITNIELVATDEGYVLRVTAGMIERILETKVKNIRFFKMLDTAGRFIRDDLGVSKFTVDNTNLR